LTVYLASGSVELLTVVPDLGNQVTRLLRTQSMLLGEILDLVWFATRNTAAITAVVSCSCHLPFSRPYNFGILKRLGHKTFPKNLGK
jgi:hypothetical protein